MRAGGGKTIALASVAAGGAVLVTCVLSSWETLCELWYLQRFNSRDPATRLAAGETLAEMGSLRALPFFLEILSKQGGDARAAPAGVFVKKIIDRRGPAAEPYLTAYLERGVGTSRTDVMYLTLQHFPSHAAALNALSGKIQEEDSSARELDLDFLKGVRADRVFCLRKVLEARSGDARECAALKLEEIGAKAQAAIPALTEAARDPAVAVRLAACCALAKAGAEPDLYRDGLLEGLRLEDEGRSRHALEVIREVGRNCLPLLIGAVESGWPEARLSAARELREIGPRGKAAAPALEDLLVKEASTDEARAARTMAALALAEMDRPAEDLLPFLAEGIWIPAHRIDEMSLGALEALGGEVQGILPALLEALLDFAGEDPNPYGFSKLSRAIVAVGREALPDLLALLRDARPRVRALALAVLRDMKSAARPAIPAVREALHDPDPEVTLFAAWVQEGLGEHAPEALSILTGWLETEEDLQRRLEILKFLGSMGEAGRPAARQIIAFLHDRDWIFRLAAVESLGRVGAPAAEAVPPLIRALGDRERTVRWAAAAALRKFGPEASSASRALEEALGGSDPLAIWAAFALMAIEPNREAEHFRRVLDGLAKKSALERSEAVRALGLLGPRVAGAALPQLIALAIHAEDEPLRFLAREAIGHIGLADVSVSPLSELLSCDDAALRSRAAQCLAEVRSLPEDLLPGLLQALKDADETIRAPVARALGHLRSAGHQAREALQAAKGDASYSVRHAARTALKEISDRGSP